jgi:hypothetical protein
VPADNEVQLMVPQMLLSMILAAVALDVDHATAARERDFATCGSHVTTQLCTYIFDSVFSISMSHEYSVSRLFCCFSWTCCRFAVMMIFFLTF